MLRERCLRGVSEEVKLKGRDLLVVSERVLIDAFSSA